MWDQRIKSEKFPLKIAKLFKKRIENFHWKKKGKNFPRKWKQMKYSKRGIYCENGETIFDWLIAKYRISPIESTLCRFDLFFILKDDLRAIQLGNDVHSKMSRKWKMGKIVTFYFRFI